MEELDEIRLSLLAVARRDPGEEWDRARAYETVDRRILTDVNLEEALTSARQEVEARVDRVFTAYPRILRFLAAGDEGSAARELIALGEQEESCERYLQAAAYFDVAVEIAIGRDKHALILALRRGGRVRKTQGDFATALQYYRRSFDLAIHEGDLVGETIAKTGIGNVLAMQDRYAEAELAYREALASAERDPERLRMEIAQIFNNLAMVARLQGSYREAEEYFSRGMTLWKNLDSPMDLQGWYYNRGRMRRAQGDLAGAEEMLREALRFPINTGERALIVAELAEIRLACGDPRGAVQLARAAEQHAAARRSPHVLGEVYKCLGNIAREIGDADGFTFFEKALELARRHILPMLEATALVDYARLRMACGGSEEAIAYLQRAISIFRELGAEGERSAAGAVLEVLERSSVKQPVAAD
jgi:tetratricopeptide (TPR) repeat protein